VKGVTSPLLMSPYLVCSQVPRSRSIVLHETLAILANNYLTILHPFGAQRELGGHVVHIMRDAGLVVVHFPPGRLGSAPLKPECNSAWGP
jgi:hypothetical protein